MMSLEQIENDLFYLEMKDYWNDADHREYDRLIAMKRELNRKENK